MYSNFSQFGLYRYENGVSRNVKQQRSFHSKIIVCSILAMSLIFCSLLYVFFHSQNNQSTKNFKNLESKPKLPKKDFESGIEIIEISGKNISEAPKRKKRLDSDEFDRSPDSQKLIFFPSRTLKPPRAFEKPKVVYVPSIPPNHRASSRMTEPRPFKHMMTSASKPHGFQIQSTARSFNSQLNNINDQLPEPQSSFPGISNQSPRNLNQFRGNDNQLKGIKNQRPNFPQGYQNQHLSNLQISGQPFQFPMNQIHFPFQNQLVKKKKHRYPQQFNENETSPMHPIQVSGTYRHPRREKDFTKMLQSEIHQNHIANQQTMQPDPFHNFKPNSASEINQMITGDSLTKNQISPYFRRKFNHQVASIPNYKINSKDVTRIYQNVLNSGKKFQDRNEMTKAKPIQLMLDVYPANIQDMDMQQQMTNQQISETMQQMTNPMLQQYPRLPRLKPFQGYYQDPSYFNSMSFPQLMPRYPAYFRYPKLQTQPSNINPMTVAKPSQLVVHLNLFPKDKTSLKRSSTEEEMEKKRHEPMNIASTSNSSTTALPFNINFNVNTNGHPENIHHHVNLPKDPYQYKDVPETAFHPSFYYDESNNKDDDQSIMVVAPSLVYNNIHRDRPITLMLKNATTTEKPSKIISNHKYTYQTIERPKKQAKIKNKPKNFND